MLFCLWNQTKAYTLSAELHNIPRLMHYTQGPEESYTFSWIWKWYRNYIGWFLQVVATQGFGSFKLSQVFAIHSKFNKGRTHEKNFVKWNCFLKKKLRGGAVQHGPTWARISSPLEGFLPTTKNINLIENLGLRGSERWPILCQRLLHP